MVKPAAIRVAILWHMHQPDYREPHTKRLALPWVRLHALKDYLDMPVRAGSYSRVKATFNLVPSLLDQLELYLDGGTDRHMELSGTDVGELSAEQRVELLETFFSANPTHMIDPYPRYRELYAKYKSCETDQQALASYFSSVELLDLQVWSNLTWIDPLFRSEEPVKTLFAKQRHYTKEDRQNLLQWELKLMGRVVPTYRKLQDEGKIEVSFTPYYHPILPLLCDTDVARDALPSIKLPSTRFAHPEDAEHQVRMAVDKYRELFGRNLVGMWPSEGSISEETLHVLRKVGIKWTASDQEVLDHSLMKSGLDPADNPTHQVYEFGPGVKLLFRDHALSDRIGFVYSTWEAERAVSDFIGHIKQLRQMYINRLDEVVIPVILDGENAWEYFPEDGADFLDLLYRTFDEDEELKTVTMAEATTSMEAMLLPSIYAGSWINHNFRIWIGHDEDNTAWELLKAARDTVEGFQREHPDYDADKLAAAWEQIYIAEGSDWCWWYGDEHRSTDNERFDRIFRQHVMAVYEHLGLDVPTNLLRSIITGAGAAVLLPPENILGAKVDGRITHFYEWAGAGLYDCLKAGGTMHRVDRLISRLHFGFDHDRLYIRLDFNSKKSLELVRTMRIVVNFSTPSPVIVNCDLSRYGSTHTQSGKYCYAIDDIFELAVERNFLWPIGFGVLDLEVGLHKAGQEVEKWPEGEPIKLDVPERSREIFWPT